MRSTRQRNARRGSSIVELALVFLPMMALVCGVFEIGRAMWTYHSISAAVKAATRYTIVRGAGCSAQSSGCALSVGDVAQRIRESSLGLQPSELSVTLQAGSQTISCPSLADCLASSTSWPTSPNNVVGQMVTITGQYPFKTCLFGFFPEMSRSGFTFQSASSEVIQF